MKNVTTETDDRLVEVLDEALREIRSGRSIDVATWQQSHPELSVEGSELLDTLVLLSAAADTWRGSDLSPDATIPDAPTHGGRATPEKIGRYRIRRLIGSGAMGDVYEGYDPQLDRRVAVKLPRCERLASNRDHFTERFLRESRAAAAVRHAHICPVYDTGKHDEQPYVVMAFVEGESLEAVLSRGRIEDIRHAVELTAQVAEALDAIHQHGIIHRDLKPGNILIDEAGHALLTDFGLAVSVVSTERLTSDGLIIGTPVYMSPEQAAGENSTLTPAADIYSLGAVLYEMMTGAVPFRAPLLELLRRIKTELPDAPTELRPDVDPELSQIALRAMAKAPSERFRSAEEMSTALRTWLETNSSSAAIRERESRPSETRKVQRLHRRISPGALIALAITGVSGVAWQLSHRPVTALSATEHRSAAVTAPALTSPNVTAPAPLSGEFAITISSDPERGPVTKNRVRVNEDSRNPLRTGEIVQFEARLNRPAFMYLLWVSPDGSVTPLYPWDAEHFPGFDAPRVAGSDRPTDHVTFPNGRKAGFEAVDPVGLQTFVMLGRREPLPAEVNLAEILAKLPAGPEIDLRTAMQPRLRGIKTGETKSLDHTLFDELEQRLSPHFELVQMMTFPQAKE